MSSLQLILISQAESLLHESMESVSEINRNVLVEVAMEKIQQIKHVLLPSANKKHYISLPIRTQREACGLTTAELARLLDLDEEIIIQWENGECEPTISMLIPLANVLGCDPLSLLSENNTAVPVRVNAPEVNAESIGARIESARKKLGLTESDLARMIHTYSDPINDWECGICEVPADQIVPLASALHCDPMWLLTGKPTDGGTCA